MALKRGFLMGTWALQGLEAMIQQAFLRQNREKPMFSSPQEALCKLLEEAGEVAACMNKGAPFSELQKECGDLLWTTSLLLEGEQRVQPGLPRWRPKGVYYFAVIFYALIYETQTMTRADFAEASLMAYKWFTAVSESSDGRDKAQAVLNMIRDTYNLGDKQ